MAIAFDASATGTSAGVSFTCAGSDRILFVLTSGTGTVTGATYNSVAMTALAGPLSGEAHGAAAWLFYLLAPATGTHTIDFTGTSLNMGVAAVSYTGVNQTVPEVVSSTASSTSAASWTTTLTTLTDNAWLVFGHWGYAYGGDPTAGAGLTLRQIDSNNKNGFFDSNAAETPTGSYSGTTNHAFSAGYAILHVAMSIAPVVVGGGASATFSPLLVAP